VLDYKYHADIERIKVGHVYYMTDFLLLRFLLVKLILLLIS